MNDWSFVFALPFLGLVASLFVAKRAAVNGKAWGKKWLKLWSNN